MNIHCDGCLKKVKKVLHKIDGKTFSFFIKPRTACLFLLFAVLSCSSSLPARVRVESETSSAGGERLLACSLLLRNRNDG